MNLAVDVDEVLFPYNRHFLEFYKDRMNGFRLEDLHSFEMEKVFGCTRDEIVKLHDDFALSQTFRTIRPISLSKHYVNLLSRQHKLFAVSGRPQFLQSVTEEFIHSNYGERIKEVVCTSSFHKNLNSSTKVEECKKRDIKLILEDSARYAVECAAQGIAVVLFDYSWNQPYNNPGVDHHLIHRVRFWPEAYQAVGLLVENQ